MAISVSVQYDGESLSPPYISYYTVDPYATNIIACSGSGVLYCTQMEVSVSVQYDGESLSPRYIS